MIHLHNTLPSPADLPGTTTTKTAASQDTSANFRSALSDAVSSTTLEQVGTDPNQVQVSTTPAATSSTPSNSTPGATQNNSDYDPFAQAATNSWVGVPVPAVNSSTTAATSEDGMPPPSAAADPTLAFDNAYWAQQPAAVQALRNMPESEREGYAQQLASEGYQIDVPIMVWGWDPSMVTSMRQADGYTWVPSAMQNPVEVAPGLGALGNLAAYNPNNPPPGSIAVS
ncbi:MAG TPA: hypothetical protein VME17_18605 [Bryobacteraceae bacterium]|nr:hypothetical protein [Bryobacteraceae bacterium]